MTDKEQQPAAPTNLERLIIAAMAVEGAPVLPVLRQVIADRLEEIKRTHEPMPDQQA
jgi:hypothetical protein